MHLSSRTHASSAAALPLNSSARPAGHRASRVQRYFLPAGPCLPEIHRSVTLWLAHLCLAALAFFAVNWLGRHAISAGYHQISFIADSDDAPAFNTIFRILAPIVFLVVTAGFWYSLGGDAIVAEYYRVTILYFAVRWGFSIATGRRLLLNWPKQFMIGTVSVALSFALYSKVLRYRHNLLPDPANLANELWIVIILFLYSTVNQVEWSLGPSAAKRRHDYIVSRYRQYVLQFGAVVRDTADSRLAEAIAYAILIYESFNRPPFYQMVERYVLFPVGLSRSLGPMQVRTDTVITDDESVRAGVRKVARDMPAAIEEVRKSHAYYFDSQARRDASEGLELPRHIAPLVDSSSIPIPPSMYGDVAAAVAKSYNIRSDYPQQVESIFLELRETFYRDLNPLSQEQGDGVIVA